MQAKPRSFRQKISLIIVATIAAIVSGCVESHTPILTKTEPVLGSQFEVHLYSTFVAGRARNVEVLVYRWYNHEYRRAEQQSEDAAELVVESLDETSFIVQTRNSDDAPLHYSIAQKIFDGVFLVRPIEETDAAPETQAKICGNHVSGIICMIRNSDQLVELAHATAGKPPHNPLLAVIVRSGE